MPCRESSHIVRPMTIQFARRILPATATPEVGLPQMFYPRWQRELRKSYKRVLPTSGSGTTDPCSSSMAPVFRCRTRHESSDVPTTTKTKARVRLSTSQNHGVLLSLATGACHDLAIASYSGKGTGETNLFRRMYDTLKPGDVVLADALFDDYFIACELCNRDIDLVAHAQYERVGSWTAGSRRRWRHHRLAASQQAARNDGRAVSEPTQSSS